MDDANFSPPPAQDSASGGYSLYAKGGAGLVLLLLAILIYILMRGRCSCTTECNGDSKQGSGGTPKAMHFMSAGE
ncbi:hypothetical protein NC652_029145 [Populus alba x Populus x berolinensis]|nr:hypothetical protein NC652_029145 [Populus alba x Populus x berolinensis]